MHLVAAQYAAYSGIGVEGNIINTMNGGDMLVGETLQRMVDLIIILKMNYYQQGGYWKGYSQDIENLSLFSFALIR